MLKKNKKVKNKCLEECNAICCNDLAVQIYKPVTKAEKEDLRWHLFFEGVKAYIRHRKWHLLIHSRCRYLSKENRCTIYDRRPDRCRKHNHPHCELEGKFFDVIIESPEQFDEYFAQQAAKKRKSKVRRAKR